MSLLGIDIGSGSCKTVLFARDGNILAQASCAYSVHSPAPDIVEIGADVFWQALVKTVREITEQVNPKDILALAVSSHGETIVPVDSAGNPVAMAIMNSDNRAITQSNYFEREFGIEKIYAITGLPLHPMFGLNKILWLRTHRPEIYSKTDKFVNVADYILLKMGFGAYTDYSLASRVMAFDIRKKKWSKEILNFAQVSSDKFSEPVAAGTKIGNLSSDVASLLGLEAGTVVTIGGHDQPCSALGSGAITSDIVADSAGTYECLSAISKEPHNSPLALKYRLNSYCHVVPDRYITLAFFPAGILTQWFIREFCDLEWQESESKKQNLFTVLDEKAVLIGNNPTNLVITPHLVGSCNPHWDVRATGVILGLTPHITKWHIYRAVYEGIASELALNVEVLSLIAGKFSQIRISGGNAKSFFTIQLRADLTGKTIQTLNSNEAVCRGAAILAGIAAGVYKNIDDAIKQVVKTDRTFVPNSTIRELYEPQLTKYRAVYPSLEKIRSLQGGS